MNVKVRVTVHIVVCKSLESVANFCNLFILSPSCIKLNKRVYVYT